jgi:hypothetical protein
MATIKTRADIQVGVLDATQTLFAHEAVNPGIRCIRPTGLEGTLSGWSDGTVVFMSPMYRVGKRRG